MRTINSNHIWLPEPAVDDPTYAGRAEGIWAWLQRSTVLRAIESRRFLNSNLAQLPSDYADSLNARLSHSWRSAFFELVVARTLQVIGATLEIEPSPDGFHRPDFKATFMTGSVIVEATSPVFRGDLQEEMVQKDKLVSIIEELAPPEWIVLVEEVPNLGHADSKKEFTRVVAELLDVDPPQDDEWIRVTGTARGEIIDLTLIPKGDLTTAIAGGPAHTFWGNGVDSIKKAVRRKRRQVRGATDPALLAINASELVCDMDTFDQALFGHDHLYVDENADPVRTEFIADGVLNPRGDGPPTYAGVLAYLEVGFRCSHEPILFLHPRFKGEIPPEFRRFQQRVMKPRSGISTTPAEGKSVLESLGPVTA